jgi:hypothetical protein
MTGRKPLAPPPNSRTPATPGALAQPHPGTLALATALDQSQPLTVLLQRLHQSRARFAAIEPHLDAGLRSTVRPGPLDDAGWSLLVTGGATAASCVNCCRSCRRRCAPGWLRHADPGARAGALTRSPFACGLRLARGRSGARRMLADAAVCGAADDPARGQTTGGRGGVDRVR